MKKLATVTEENNFQILNLEKEKKDLEDKLLSVKYFKIFLNCTYIFGINLFYRTPFVFQFFFLKSWV